MSRINWPNVQTQGTPIEADRILLHEVKIMPRNKMLALLGFVTLFAVPGILMYAQPDPFTSFNLELNTSGSVYVQWKIGTNARNVRFEVEKSRDQKKWETIQTIPPQLASQYSHLDGKPFQGINYYRIKLFNEKGESVYSEVRSIELEDKSNFRLWPQPATNVLHAEFPFSYGTFEIIDGSGRISKKQSITAFKTDISLKELPAGVYFARIKHDNKACISQFIKQ